MTQTALFAIISLVTVLLFILSVVIVSQFVGAAQEREKRARAELEAIKKLYEEEKQADEELDGLSNEALRDLLRDASKHL